MLLVSNNLDTKEYDWGLGRPVAGDERTNLSDTTRHEGGRTRRLLDETPGRGVPNCAELIGAQCCTQLCRPGTPWHTWVLQ